MNNAFFIHSHILNKGRVLVHAHPFNSQEDSSHPLHKHKTKELLYLNFIFYLFSSALISLFVYYFFKTAKYEILSIIIRPKLFYFLKTNSPRSPPFLLAKSILYR